MCFACVWVGDSGTDLLAEIIIDAIPSTVPVGVLIVVFCQPLNASCCKSAR